MKALRVNTVRPCPRSIKRPTKTLVPAEMIIELDSPDEKVIAVIDGQDNYEMHEGDVLTIKGAEESAKLLHRKERNYFSVLREKLKWGDEN